MKKKLLKLLNYTLILFLLALSGCEKDFYEDAIKEPAKANGQINYVTIDDVPLIKPNVEKFKKNISSKTAKGKISDLDLDLEHIIQYTESNGFTSYSIPVKIDTLETKDYYFQNLNIITDGKEYGSFVVKYNPDNDLKTFDLSTFTGTTEYYDENLNLKKSIGFVNGTPNESHTINTGKGNNLTNKNEAPAPSPGGDDEIGGGGGIDDGGSCPCNSTSLIQQFYNWVGKVLAGINNISITLPEGSGNNKAYVLVVTPPNTGTPTYAGSTVETFSGGGSITFVPNEPQWTYPISSQYLMASRIMQRIEATDPPVFTWLADANNVEYVKTLYFYLHEENSITTRQFAKDIITQIISNPSLKIDFMASFKSPMNIDISTITNATPEGAKFIEIYGELTKSPEFRNLFISIFDKSNRFNVKFELAEHVYEDNDPTKKEVNATTSQDPVTKNIIIKVSKQILKSGTTKSQTKIENAKTILHECIHAYLFVKANNPAVGTDFVKILNKMYPMPNEQHDFMYSFMIPTMQKVLGEIRDLVTTAPKRANIETYTMHPTQNPMTSTPWIWTEYYKYISLSGLEEVDCFKADFDSSDKIALFNQYIRAGKIELDR